MPECVCEREKGRVRKLSSFRMFHICADVNDPHTSPANERLVKYCRYEDMILQLVLKMGWVRKLTGGISFS